MRHGKEFCMKLLEGVKKILHDLFLENSSGCYVENKLQKGKKEGKGYTPGKRL